MSAENSHQKDTVVTKRLTDSCISHYQDYLIAILVGQKETSTCDDDE
jgi:hypothetical protein